jgi:hypothetical protein
MSGSFARCAIRGLAILSVLLAVSAPGQTAVVEKAPEFGGLFLDVPAPKSEVKVRPTVSRRRVVTVDLPALHARKTPGARLSFNLFIDVNLEGVVEQVMERGDDDFTLAGRLSGQEFSTFILVVKDGVAVANIRTEDGSPYQVRHLGDSFYDLRQIDATKYAPCGTTGEHAVAAPVPPAVPAKVAEPKTAKDAGDTMDVMVVYTPAARAAAGGTAAMQALINLAVDESNFAYQFSQITPRLRLVYQQEVPYTETGSMNVDLDRLTGTGDGFVDQVHALRDTYGADMVSMFIENTNLCGLAWLMTALSPGFADSAFSVVTWDCATGNYSFAHELGHNMGCAHDRANAVGGGLYPYSYGWRFVTAGNVTNRTIMAYAPGERIQRFSNPDVLYNGVATGVPTNLPTAAHNALTINNSAFTVANWRQTAAACLFTIAPVSTNVPRGPFDVTVAVSVSSNNCPWNATSASPFITFVGPTNGIASGSFTFSVATNTGLNARTGTVLVAGLAFTVVQSGNAPFISLGEAVDLTNRTWVTGGNLGWFGQSTIASNNADAAQSGAITHNQQSYMESVFYGPSKLSFWWKVGSEPGYDFLRVAVDGAVLYSVSGVVDWQYRTIYLTNGAHLVRWSYSKDLSLSQNGDAAWLDLVRLSEPPYFTNGVTSLGGNLVRLDLRGSPSSTVVLESSTNLSMWSPFATGIINASGTWSYSNAVPGIPRRFYRALVP